MAVKSELHPMKKKSSPAFHWCYVCKDWFFVPVEDFRACGHYDATTYRDLLVHMGTPEGRVGKEVLRGAPNKPKPPRPTKG